MKIVSYTQCGEPADVLELVETNARPPGPGEVRVEVLSAPIHNADLLQVRGLYGRSPALPATPGGEAVGRVVEVGEGVTHLAVGMTVFITTGTTWAQQVTIPAAGLIPLPEGDLDQLAMLVSSPATAHLLLEGYGDLKEGDWLIQSAANSAVGSTVVQLAKTRGLRTVNIVRRQEVVAGLEELGADVVLVGTDDLVARVQEATGGAPIGLALDAIGGEVFSLLVDVLAMGGTLVTYSQVELGSAAVTPGDLIFKQITVTGFWLSQWFTDATPAEKQALFGQLVPLVASGELRMAVDSTWTLDQLAEAVTRSMGGRRNGKVLFHPNG
jgi:mitochondrial enoyl-[acyl-carrier protein] reductase / trans-2-enoyl-CoA reductase